jgi:hypothetical protein
MNHEMIALLKAKAARDCFYDDEDESVIVDDYAGGNIDDAFALGERAGEVLLARKILSSMNIDWKSSL